MERLRERDPEALAEIYDSYAGLVLALALRILRERAAAEEVVSQSFWQVWEQAPRYSEQRGSPAAWIISIARSRALDLLRSEDRERRRRERASEQIERQTEPVQGPADWTLEGERRRFVMAALASLPGEQRECVELAYYQGLSHREIAARTGAPLGTVKTRILLAMEKLREALAPLTSGSAP
jgi:RNA polymerase sigma-70 factor (ECF subfamily)